jgi:hypothetical protein
MEEEAIAKQQAAERREAEEQERKAAAARKAEDDERRKAEAAAKLSKASTRGRGRPVGRPSSVTASSSTTGYVAMGGSNNPRGASRGASGTRRTTGGIGRGAIPGRGRGVG